MENPYIVALQSATAQFQKAEELAKAYAIEGPALELGTVVIDRFACGESAGYPTICKGRYRCDVKAEGYYAFEDMLAKWRADGRLEGLALEREAMPEPAE